MYKRRAYSTLRAGDGQGAGTKLSLWCSQVTGAFQNAHGLIFGHMCVMDGSGQSTYPSLLGVGEQSDNTYPSSLGYAL